MSTIRVTITTEVIEPVSGRAITTVIRSDEQISGNPLFITRTAHDLTARLSNDTREMLKSHYKETSSAWAS